MFGYSSGWCLVQRSPRHSLRSSTGARNLLHPRLELLEERLTLSADGPSSLLLSSDLLTGAGLVDVGEIRGIKWNDIDADHTIDEGEGPLPDWTIYLDSNNNGQYDAEEPSTVTGSDGTYVFTDLSPGTYWVGEVQQAGWEQVTPRPGDLDRMLVSLDASASSIASLVPRRFNFLGGEDGYFIEDGGRNMYDYGNFLATNLYSYVPYSNRFVTAADAYFGPGSEYFTAKYPGLFALAAKDISINDFTLFGDNGADGTGVADGTELTTTVNGKTYTLYIKRVYNNVNPTINEIIMVPGDGTGIAHNYSTYTNDGFHQLTGLADIDELYYVLVSSARSSIGFGQLQSIAEAFLATVPGGNVSVELAAAEVETVDFGNRLIPGEIRGTKWNDLDGDGQFDVEEPVLPGWTMFLDTNDSGQFDEGEPTAVTDFNGVYQFTEVVPGTHTVGEIPQAGWEQTFPSKGIDRLLTNLNDSASDIAALVPSRFDFLEGDVGYGIIDGGNNMYDYGNYLYSSSGGTIPYTNGAVTPGDAYLGPGSQYFTAKYPGLFAFAATDISIYDFTVYGDNGADGNGRANGSVLSTTVDGRNYRLYIKRVYGAGVPSINEIFIVPGDGAGIQHNFATYTNDGFHQVTGLSNVDELYYLLVSSQNGGIISSSQIKAIADQFLQAIPGEFPTHSVDVVSGQVTDGINFGNYPLPGEIRGTKWYDLDRNGYYSPDEPGQVGWTVYLDDNFNGILDPGERSAVTDVDGNYVITDVPYGYHFVQTEFRPGWVRSYANNYVFVGPGETVQGINFGDWAGVVLEFESSLGTFEIPAGTTFQVTVKATMTPEAITGYQLSLVGSSAYPGGLTVANWAVNPDLWPLEFDGDLDSETGDLRVAAASPVGHGGVVTLGTFDVTVPDVFAGSIYNLYAGYLGPYYTEIVGPSGSLYIAQAPYVPITVLENDGPQVVNVTVNTGIANPADLPSGLQPTTWQDQRSDIRTIRVTLSEEVREVHAADLRLTNLGVIANLEPDKFVPLADSQISHAGNTIVIALPSGFLNDGVYSLEIMPTVMDLAGNVLDGNGDGVGGDSHLTVGNEVNRFFKLKGDFNGDGGVSVFDMPTLNYWYGQDWTVAPRYADLNGDYAISIGDFPVFSAQFGRSIVFPTEGAAILSTPVVTVVKSSHKSVLLQEVADHSATSLAEKEESGATTMLPLFDDARRSTTTSLAAPLVARRSDVASTAVHDLMLLLAESRVAVSTSHDGESALCDRVFEEGSWPRIGIPTEFDECGLVM